MHRSYTWRVGPNLRCDNASTTLGDNEVDDDDERDMVPWLFGQDRRDSSGPE